MLLWENVRYSKSENKQESFPSVALMGENKIFFSLSASFLNNEEFPQVQVPGV